MKNSDVITVKIMSGLVVLAITSTFASVPPAEAGAGAPVVARVAHRGKVGSPSSDFGSLEVFGLASVGKADPWALSDLLGQRLAGC